MYMCMDIHEATRVSCKQRPLGTNQFEIRPMRLQGVRVAHGGESEGSLAAARAHLCLGNNLNARETGLTTTAFGQQTTAKHAETSVDKAPPSHYEPRALAALWPARIRKPLRRLPSACRRRSLLTAPLARFDSIV